MPGGRRRRRRALRITRRDLRLGAQAFIALFAVGAVLHHEIAAGLQTASDKVAAWAALAGRDAPSRTRAVQSSADSVRLRVVDGDTVEVRGTNERVRLANIDTPEAGDRAQCAAERAAAAAATVALRRLISRADSVQVQRTGRRDSYGRTVGFIRLDGDDLGRLMIAAGHARAWQGSRQTWCALDGALLR
ncbi:MAG: thermonuclease family protein [Alphaproteobacteria bacterium]|nr:thermonuclease family protein [Alphaproteobacteria bacterium]